MPKFKALVVTKLENKVFLRTIEDRKITDLPKGDVLIRVHYSSINYKDCLSCIGNPGVTRHYPHTPGVDAAGIVEWSETDQFKMGDNVIVISKGLGVNMPGGFGQYISVPSNWVMQLPGGITLHESMMYGTAGYTAALAIEALKNNQIHPDSGFIAVTGSTGGVGSMAIAMLEKLGYQSIASTGKSDAIPFLTSIGATKVVSRETMNEESGRNMLMPEWAGAVDTVGGNTLATLIKKCKEGGVVATTGNIASQQLNMTVLPFILRGISLVGIYAEGTNCAHRQMIWSKMANDWKPRILHSMATTIQLEELSKKVDDMLSGLQVGRVVLDLR